MVPAQAPLRVRRCFREEPVSARVSAIVVVEDDAGLRQAIERLLTVAGFQTRTFADAPALLDSSAATSAQCLVLDVHLPSLSGFELHERLVKSGVACPVVFITAYDGPEARQRAACAGGAYLAKPFAGRELVSTITSAIQHGPRALHAG
jgi:FixJ family two-component response regulator